MKFQIKTLDSLPKDKIYLVPVNLRCPNCNSIIGNLYVFLKTDSIACFNCLKMLTISDFAKQFGVIEVTEE